MPIPAANGMFTARSLASMYALLANDGELDGVRLLRRDTVWRATEVQNRGIGRVIPVPMHWRLGYHRVPTLGAACRTASATSASAARARWADPDRELAVAMTVNSGIGTPFGDLRIVRIGTAAVRCAERCPTRALGAGSSTTLIAPAARSAAVANASAAASSGKRCVISARATPGSRARSAAAASMSRDAPLRAVHARREHVHLLRQSAKPGSSSAAQ